MDVMYRLIATICWIAEPGACFDLDMQAPPTITYYQCVQNVGTRIYDWLAANPDFYLQSWACSPFIFVAESHPDANP